MRDARRTHFENEILLVPSAKNERATWINHDNEMLQAFRTIEKFRA
jgi:hypothetical protein